MRGGGLFVKLTGFFKSDSMWDASSSIWRFKDPTIFPCGSESVEIILKISTVVRMHDNGVRMSWTACSTICFHGSDSSPGLADILSEALRSGRFAGIQGKAGPKLLILKLAALKNHLPTPL